MANTLKYVVTAELTGSFTTLYTVPALTLFTVAMLHVSNNTSAAKTVQICVVPAAGSPAIDNAILWDFSLPANDFLELLKGDIWGAGVTLQALASAVDSVTVRVSGVETS